MKSSLVRPWRLYVKARMTRSSLDVKVGLARYLLLGDLGCGDSLLLGSQLRPNWLPQLDLSYLTVMCN